MNNPAILWESTLDNRFHVEVDSDCVLRIFDNSNCQLLHSESVVLSYGAVFGVDAGDIEDWQMKTIDIVDNYTAKNSKNKS